MYDFSLGVINILDNIKQRSNELSIPTIGSEFLLSEMMKIEDGIFRFLMTEYDVDSSEIEEQTASLLILRKESGLYTNALEEIFNNASKVSFGKIKEEHLLYGILSVKDSIAAKIIINLGLSLKDLIFDLKEIYDFKDGGTNDVGYTTNITKKALEGKLDGLFEYDSYLKKLEVILNKKYKNNPLIIGEAGVGKSALVEGFAMYSIKNNLDYEILSLNLSQMLANTKYRGDFEGRIEETLAYMKDHPNTILFIDEIHTIMGAGATENSLDVANILKPFLARSDLKVIGATTLEEYHKTIYKDKALRRRFELLQIKEPDLEVTSRIMYGLKESYESYHKQKIDNELLDYLITESDRVILNKARPDKCIDVLDEVMSYANCNELELSKELIDSVLQERVGFKKDYKSLNFKDLLKLDFLSENNLKENDNYNFHIALEECEYSLELLKADLANCYGINEEMTLELDLKQYPDHASIQTLIGAPPGYVGYQEEGLLSRQISKHPLSLLILKNIDAMSVQFKALYRRILDSGFFYDNAGNKIFTKHLIVLDIVKPEIVKHVGFLDYKKPKTSNYDLFLEKLPISSALNSEYDKVFNKYNLNIKLRFDVSKNHCKELNNIIYDLWQKNDREYHEIGLENSLVTLIK